MDWKVPTTRLKAAKTRRRAQVQAQARQPLGGQVLQAEDHGVEEEDGGQKPRQGVKPVALGKAPVKKDFAPELPEHHAP